MGSAPIDSTMPLSTEEVSTNFYWTVGDKETFNLQTTLRGEVDPAAVKRHLANIKAALVGVVALGGHAKAVGKQPEPITTTSLAPAATTAPNGQQLPEQADTQAFQASELCIDTHDGKTYFKVKGGQFTKFGVTIWPETLAAAGLAKPTANASLAGWTAHYTNKPDGKPDKVLKLEKTGAAQPVADPF